MGNHKPPVADDLREHARELRRHATEAERRLWKYLRGRRLAGSRWRRQHPVGSYILDFYCHEARLAVELDGGGHDYEEQRTEDRARTETLTSQGIAVLRFWNTDVLQNPEGVVQRITEALASRVHHHE